MEHMNFTWSESGGEMKMGSISCCSSFHCSSETMMTNNFYKCGKTQTNVISDFNLLFNWNTKELRLLFTNTDRCTCLISISMPKATCDLIAYFLAAFLEFGWVWDVY